MVDEEIEQIKKHTETRYEVELPEIDIKYTDKTLGGVSFRPMKWREEELYQKLKNYCNAGKRSVLLELPDVHSLEFETKEELREEIRKALKNYLAQEEKKLGIKINPEKYTIVLPAYTRIHDLFYEEYLECVRLEDELKKKKGEESKLEKVRAFKNLHSFLYNHPKLNIDAITWHEMGHVLAHSKNLSGDLNEGVAILYQFKGLLLGAREGKFKIDEVKEMMKYCRAIFQVVEEWNRAFELALGDFNPDFESLEKAIQDIERRINRYVKKKENIY